MNPVQLIKETPHDMAAFGIPTWEVLEYSITALQKAVQTVGHHTLRVDPLANKKLLHEFGFYYCDTLIEPHCSNDRLNVVKHPDATISKEIDKVQALAICHGAFDHGRFHRDFNLPKAAADQRYNNWLNQLLGMQKVYGLYWQGTLAGFIGYSKNTLVLHALANKYRGKSLAKFWWGLVCSELMANGHEKVKSSISVTNLAVVKLYASLGFSFNNPQDIYHRIVM